MLSKPDNYFGQFDVHRNRLSQVFGRIAYDNRKRRPELSRWLRKRLPVRRMTIGKTKVILHPGDNHTEFFAWFHGYWPEQESIHQLSRIVRNRKSLIIDVGANCGSFSTALAAEMGPDSSLIAVEANPVMASRLRSNLEANGQLEDVKIEMCALGSEKGEAELTLHAVNLGKTSMKKFKRNIGGKISVSVMPLSDLVKDRSTYEVFVLKIDIEGFEDEVLIPYFQAVPENPLPDFILIEVNHKKQWARDLLSEILSQGYESIFVGDDNTLFKLVKTRAIEEQHSGGQDGL